MTINLNGNFGRFTGEYFEKIDRKKQEQRNFELQKIVNKLRKRTWISIEQIVKNIGDHPNPNLLIENLEKNKNFGEIIEILAKVIQNSSYSVEKILRE